MGWEVSARIAALREAADSGWADLAAGRYEDIADDNLDDFIGQLGARQRYESLIATAIRDAASLHRFGGTEPPDGPKVLGAPMRPGESRRRPFLRWAGGQGVAKRALHVGSPLCGTATSTTIAAMA